MMIPIMSQIGREAVKFTGEKTLLGRPLTGAKEIMDACEAKIADQAGNDADLHAGNDERHPRPDRGSDAVSVPLTVKGPLKAGRAEISGKHGSQLISGLLMALPFAEKNSGKDGI